MIPFVDGHTHSVPAREDVTALVNLPYPERPEKLPGSSRLFFSAGIHPSRTGQSDFDGLESYLHENHCRAIGECGLDRSIDVPLEEQMELFLLHVRLAERLRLPLVIHCVRAYYDLIAARKRLGKSAVPWVVHGFRGNAEIAAALQEHGFILSLSSGYVVHMEKFPYYVRRDMFLLETDDGQDSIESLYDRTVRAGGWEPGELKQQLFTNFQHLFQVVS